MTVGYFSPLPPARTGVAEYAEGLLNALRKFGEVRVNDVQASVCLYQIGNNHLHRAIYQQALKKPGVVLLHDAVLQHFLLGWQSEEEYVEEFVFNYGEWTRDLARGLYSQRSASGVDPRYFQYPLLLRLLKSSLLVVVHNPGALDIVRAHAPHANVVELPHYFQMPDLPAEDVVREVRASVGVPPAGALFGVFGHLRETKRVGTVIRAFQRAHAADSRLRLLIAGEPASRDLRRFLDAAIEENPAIIRREYLPEREFWAYATAVDACVNLRFPTAGETSGIGIRLMGIGKPVVFTDGAEVARYPAGACLRVEAGQTEEATLAAYLLWLGGYLGDAAVMGQAAAEHIAAQHGLPAISARLWDLLCQFTR